MSGHGTSGGSEPIVYIDHSHIREDSVDELKAGGQVVCVGVVATALFPTAVVIVQGPSRVTVATG